MKKEVKGHEEIEWVKPSRSVRELEGPKKGKQFLN